MAETVPSVAGASPPLWITQEELVLAPRSMPGVRAGPTTVTRGSGAGELKRNG